MRASLILTALAPVIALGCAVVPSHPPESELTRASNAIRTIHPGDHADKVYASFKPLRENDCAYVGIVTNESYQAVDSASETLWIGYYYTAGSVGIYPIIEQQLVCAFTIINGLVDSIYRP